MGVKIVKSGILGLDLDAAGHRLTRLHDTWWQECWVHAILESGFRSIFTP